MTKYILINRIKVQNANAVAGFTWGFPSITHFLGFQHGIMRQLRGTNFKNIELLNCGVFAHEHHVHTYGDYKDRFTQSKNPPYRKGEKKPKSSPPVIEEGKMNMTVSLLIGYSGNLGHGDDFFKWLRKRCFLQRLAGGTILDIGKIQAFDLVEDKHFFLLKRKLLPGFALIDRSDALAAHYNSSIDKNENTELLEAWLDFSLLKRKARPKSNLIKKHLTAYDKHNTTILMDEWRRHIASGPYNGEIPELLIKHFEQLDNNKNNNMLLNQWRQYLTPDNKSAADWEYLPKPTTGYLIPIMTGYKAISPLYKNSEIKNTRDYKTDVRFVESIHSIGEWLGVNRLKTTEDFINCQWEYFYEGDWYLCRQCKKDVNTNFIKIRPGDEF